ncbi:hypothetical protein BGX26_005420 [Mortierella sp. AD094]|nr:hypothetical protein BGX26_005420 [Mortierella sp. AD094]
MVPAPPEEFVLALERLECLTKFKSTGCKYDGETIARLLKTHSSTLQVLGFSCDEIIRYQQEDSLVTTIHKIALPNLKILTLEKISNTVEVDLQLRLIQQAPELISVCWDLGDYPFPGSLFCQLVLPSCPKIENVYLTAAKQDSKNLVLHSDLYLSIADPNHSHPDPHHNQKEPTPLDETLAQILDLSRITKMESTSSGFGPLSMSAIRRHSSVLSSLNFRKCAQFTSSMAQECLSTMPLLVRLSADKISQLDIIKGYESGAPWVCKGLRVLELCIVGLPSVHLEIDQDPEELQQNLAVIRPVMDLLNM